MLMWIMLLLCCCCVVAVYCCCVVAMGNVNVAVAEVVSIDIMLLLFPILAGLISIYSKSSEWRETK